MKLSASILLATACVASADHYRVYLLGGQSNGNGRADAAQLTSPLDAPQTDVRFYWHRTQYATNVGHLLEDQWIDLAPGSGHGSGGLVFDKEFGPELSFGRAMADEDPAANIAIIKYTHGGTNLSSNWSATGDQYLSFVSTVQAGLAALTNAGHTYELRGMLWQQGETDTGSATASNNYETNLTNLIARVRTDLAGGASLPFVIGSLSDSQYSDINTPGSGPYKVRQAQEVVAAADPTVGLVITDGYTVRADGIHFDHDGQIALGQAHAEAMQLLEAPPNVIFIISDDQPWYDFSFMYRPEFEEDAIDAMTSVRQVARTPAVDRLADGGLTFTSGYTTPLCRPSLMSIITGTYPHANGITGNDPAVGGRNTVLGPIQNLNPLPRTLANEMGYTSFQTGKWWEGDYSYGGFTAGDTVNHLIPKPPQWNTDPPSYVQGGREGDWGLMAGRVDYVNDVAAPAHPIPYANTVQTVTDFIDVQVAADQPFFVWYAPFLPHWPLDPPAGLLAEYTALGLVGDEAKYYANVERFDGGVGAILDHLDASGITDNTLIVFICDNGRDVSYRGKKSPYEDGIRTPIIVHWPKRIRPGGELEPRIITTPVSLVDMVPTVHHALGLPVPTEMTGVDLMNLDAVNARDTVFMEHNGGPIQLEDPTQTLKARIAIRDGWKLILPYSSSSGLDGSPELYQLYDTSTGGPVDPFELNDLAATEPTRVIELIRALDGWYDPSPERDDSLIRTFGTGANQFTMEFVEVGNPGNADDSTGFGGVDYAFGIAKHEVTIEQFTKARAADGNKFGDGDEDFWNGSQGDQAPATMCSWLDAAKFANWLTTGDSDSGYYSNGTGFVKIPTHGLSHKEYAELNGVTYFVTTEDEWYKAAYYDPSKGGSGGYWAYPTMADAAPDGIDSSGDTTFDAVFKDGFDQNHPHVVSDSGLASAYGTCGQGGNVIEWNEYFNGVNRFGTRGGHMSQGESILSSVARSTAHQNTEGNKIGFRVSMVRATKTFGSWISGYDLGGQTGFDDDPDGDQLPNGIEALFGSHPGAFNTGISGVVTDGTTSTFVHPHRGDPVARLSLYYEWSSDILDWYAGDGVDGPVGGPRVGISSNVGVVTTSVTATASEPMSHLFLRVGARED